MKDRIIPIKNPALPFYHSDVKSKIKDTIEVTYNTNAFYIFCKNFEVIAAEVFKFEKIKTTLEQTSEPTSEQTSKMSTLCTSIALNTLDAGYDFEDVANYLKKEFNVEVVLQEDSEIDREVNEMLTLAKALTKITSTQLSRVLVQCSPLFGKCSKQSIELVTAYINAALVELESSRFCNIFSIYEYLLNNYSIFTDVVNQIEYICNSFAGVTTMYTENGFKDLEQFKKLCINTISVDKNLEMQPRKFTSFEKESILLYFSLGTPKHNTKRINDFVNYLCKQQNISWEHWEKMLMLTFKRNDLFRKVFNYSYVADFVLASNSCIATTTNGIAGDATDASVDATNASGDVTDASVVRGDATNASGDVTDASVVRGDANLIDEETLAQVKYIFSKEEEIIQFLLDNNNWENNCKTLATISLNDVLEENFRNMCDNAYNDFSKKAYNASNDCNDFSEKAYSSFNEE